MALETDLQVYYHLAANTNDLWNSDNATNSGLSFGTYNGVVCSDLNGTSDYAHASSSTYNFSFGTGDFTFSVWAYPDSVSCGAACSHVVFGTDYRNYELYFYENTIQFKMAATNNTISPTATAGAWVHITIVRSGSTVTPYINGVAGTPITNSSDITAYSTPDLNIGRRTAASNYFDGNISDVCMWKRAITAVEIAAIYAAGAGNFGTLLPDAKLRGMIGSAVHDVPASYLKLEGMIGSVVHDSPPTTAVVPDIAGPVLVPATFDGSGSTAISYYNWAWVSVPGGSSVGPVGIIPLPDGGGVGPPDMTNNAVLYHCEEVAGTTGTDTSGSTNDATLTTITVGQPGKVGSYAWQYTATGSKAVFAASVPIAATDYTIAFWFKGVAPSSTWRVGARASGADYHIIVESGSNRLGLYSGGFKDSGATLAVGGDWRHLVSVGTGGDTLFYVDGALAGTVVGTQSTDAIDSIGNKPSGGMRFADYIDEAAIWTRALSAAEILNIYNLQTGVLGTASTYAFTPDVAGTYTINLAVSASENTNADAVITAPSGAVPKSFQGDSFQGEDFEGDDFQGD